MQDPDVPATFHLITTLDSLSDTPSFDIWEYIDNELTYAYPEPSSSSVMNSSASIRQYKLVAEAYDEDNALQQTLTVDNSGDNYIAIKGGLSYELYASTDFFNTYLTTNKSFLTWNSSATIHIQQKYYLPYLKTTSDALKLHAKVYYTDGTQESYSVADMNGDAWTLYQIPVGWEVLQNYLSISTTKTPFRVDISIRKNADDSYVSEVFQLNIHATIFRHSKTFMYYNSLGGLQVLFATGSFEEEFKVTTTGGSHLTDDNYQLHINSYATARKSFQVAGGYVSKAEYKSLRDMLFCTAIIEQKELNVYIVIDKRNFNLNESDNLHNFSFSYAYNYEDRVASPDVLRVNTNSFALLIDNADHAILIDSHHRLII